MIDQPDREARLRNTAPIELYTPAAVAACEKALRTIVARVGLWGPRLILFGGLAPRYIVEQVPEKVIEHQGTTDLDMVIGIAIESESEEEAVYTKLQQELRNADFAPSKEGSYAWERRVDGIRVAIEFFCPVEVGGRPGRLKRNPGGLTGSNVSAIQLKGAEIAGADCRTCVLEGEVLDYGGRRQVEVRVVNILPFLVLKAFALETRDKEKDAYDIIWTLNSFGRKGPMSAAEAAAQSPIAQTDYVTDAIAILSERFGTFDAKGPNNYARFFLGAMNNDEERDRLRRFAHGVMNEFLNRWAEVDLV